ncbi:unnamed protein product [Durusdinium trenchii]|uniref:CCHC-type domain-containing protein n=1 Tax=Durusdinium trenchii TaxID=1381693 RepID=A0ABP0PQ20_9DINO
MSALHLSRLARRKRCWRRATSLATRGPRRRSRRIRGKSSARTPPQLRPAVADAAEVEEELPFFLDVAGDAAAHAATAGQAAGQAAAKSSALSVSGPVVDTRPAEEQPKEQEEEELPPLQTPLAFAVIPSTATEAVEEAWAQAADTTCAQPDQLEEELEHASLDRFYRETEAKRAESRSAQLRYYNGDRPETLRTDDGYLTRLGSKHFCLLCFGTNHRAQSCPETRCWICFATGHNVKHCPRAKDKCDLCWRKGHNFKSGTGCPHEALRRAQRWELRHQVRCGVCRGEGHLMCDGSGKPPSESWDDVPELEGPQQDDTLKARAFAAAVAGRSGRGHWNTWEQRSWEEKRAEKSWASTVSVSSNWKEHKRWKDQEDWKSRGWKSHGDHRGDVRSHRSEARHRQHTVPSMRIRDQPSKRSLKRAEEKKRRR